MEKFNLNFNGGGNILKSICWLLSLAAWLLFLITGWISIFGENYKVWTITKDVKVNLLFIEYYPYIPTQMDKTFIFIVFLELLIISTVAFCLYLIYSIFIKNNSVFNGMMGNISRFHFIPITCAGGLFIIGESFKDADSEKIKQLMITALIFSIIGFITLILVHTQTKIEPWYASLIIKKGAFACLIALFTYTICYTILLIGIIDKVVNFNFLNFVEYIIFGSSDKQTLIDFINNCGTALPITIGVVNIALSIGLKDPIISFMNLLIYVGSTIYYYNIDKKTREFFENNGDGIIDIVMIVLSALAIAFLIFKYKAEAFK